MDKLDYMYYMAQMFEKFLHTNPNLCPHDYDWRGSRRVEYLPDGKEKWVATYICNVCGHTKQEEEIKDGA